MLASDLPATHRALDMADAVGVESPALNQASNEKWQSDIPFILQGSLNGTHFGGIKLDAIKCMVIFRDFPLVNSCVKFGLGGWKYWKSLY